MRSLVLYLIFSLPVQSAFLSESTSGDISNDWQAPDILILQPQSNYVSGSVSDGDPDLFTLVVPSGLELTEIRLAFYSFPIPGNRTFIGFQDGPTLLQDIQSFAADSATDISFFLFGETDQNRDLTGAFTPSPNASSGPLGAGSYAFWVNEIEPDAAEYALEFVADFAPTPEPGVLALLFAASFGILRRRR